jgi:hypothetical protein
MHRSNVHEATHGPLFSSNLMQATQPPSIPCYCVPLRPKESNRFFSTLFSNNLSLCSSLNVRDQVSTGKIIVLYILMFIFMESKRERDSVPNGSRQSRFQTSHQGNILLASPKRPDRLWGPPSLLLNRYRGAFLGVEWQGHLPTKTEAQYAQYLYSPYMPTRRRMGKRHFSWLPPVT